MRKTYYKQDLFKGVEFDLGGPEYIGGDQHMIESRIKRETEMDIFDGLKVQRIIGIYRSASKHAMRYDALLSIDPIIWVIINL